MFFSYRKCLRNNLLVLTLLLSNFLFAAMLYRSGEVDFAKNRVLLLSAARSGSSFVGEMISSGAAPDSLYVFEPLRATRQDDSFDGGVDREVEIRRILDVLFNCLPDERLWSIWKTSADECKSASTIAAKTVRLRGDVLDRWIRSQRFEVKVVHLARDPRARFYSMMNAPGYNMFAGAVGSFGRVCQALEKDFEAGEKMRRNDYLLVQYEAVWKDPEGEMRRIFHFLRWKFGDDQRKWIENHVSDSESEAEEKTDAKFFFSTRRNKDFNPDKWRENREFVQSETFKIVQSQCLTQYLSSKLTLSPLI